MSPLLAIYEAMRAKDEALAVRWIGTRKGPERLMVEAVGIPFFAIAAGKWRRYLSLRNIIDPLFVCVGFIQSYVHIARFRPDAVLTAGGFVAVPVAIAARLLNVPVFAHQQDIEIGLANKIMARFATVITVTFKPSLEQFDVKKTYRIGNPVRARFSSADADRGASFTGLSREVPTIVVLGGGQGAVALNQLVLESLGSLTQHAQIVHLTGAGKEITTLIPDYYDRETQRRISNRYRSFPFLTDELPHVLALADIVITRAGASTLSEISYLKKPAVIIPIPESHQENNAAYFAKEGAAIVLNQSELTAAQFTRVLTQLIENPADRQRLSRGIGALSVVDAAERYGDLVRRILRPET